LEAALKRGLVLVRHDCQRLEIVEDCHPVIYVDHTEQTDYRYGYEAVTVKEEVVRMNDADDVRVRLPTMGASLAADLETDLARGSSLDLALVVIGRYVTAAHAISARRVRETSTACRTAKPTHFVKSISVGAFAMSVGARADARGVAEVFHAGARGESVSSKTRAVKDGELEACRGGHEASAPPQGCGAPIRVELAKVDPRNPGRAMCEDDGNTPACIRWAQEAFWKAPPEDTPPADRPLAASKLDALCHQGLAGACTQEYLLTQGAPDIRVDVADVLKRGCDAGEGFICYEYARRLEQEGRADEALSSYESACVREPDTCGALADRFEAGAGALSSAERAQRVADLRARACLGKPDSFNSISQDECNKFAALYRKGFRARSIDTLNVKQMIDGCESPQKNQPRLCTPSTAASHAFGLGVPRDLGRAKKAWELHCADLRQIAPNQPCPFPKGWQ
jgi:hypothetical protein